MITSDGHNHFVAPFDSAQSLRRVGEMHFVHDTDWAPGHGTYVAACKDFVHEFQVTRVASDVTCSACRETWRVG